MNFKSFVELQNLHNAQRMRANKWGWGVAWLCVIASVLVLVFTVAVRAQDSTGTVQIDELFKLRIENALLRSRLLRSQIEMAILNSPDIQKLKAEAEAAETKAQKSLDEFMLSKKLDPKEYDFDAKTWTVKKKTVATANK